MKTIIGASLLLVSAVSYGHIFHDHDYEKVETKNLTLATSDLSRFVIEAGAGSLEVIGHDEATIKVTAEVYQKEKGAPYCLSLDDKGSKGKLEANSCHNDNDTRIDLTVYVPSELKTQISDGSGSISIENASISQINDGSGEIVIADNAADLMINDGSGPIRIHNQKGKLDINDGSGSIWVQDVEGDVRLKDGSGSIDVSNIAGEVSVSDGSGSISVDNAHNFILLGDGSGSVNVSNVELLK